MPSIANAADVANLSLGAVKNSAKVYNFHAKQLDDTMHIADTLNERLKELDPDLDVRIPTSRRLRVSLENRGRLARQNHQPILVPKPKRPVAAPVPRQTAETRHMADMERWRNLRAQADYAETHGRYSYEQARKMGKFGEDTSYALQMMQMLQNSQPSQMQQNAMFAQGADMGEQIRNQELEQIKKRRIKENEEVAPGTNQHRGMDPMKSVMKKMGAESTEERLRRLEAWDEIQHRKVGKVFGREVGSYWRDHPNSLFGGTGANPWSASARADAKRRMEILRLREQLGKTAEEDPYDRLKRLEAMVHNHDKRRYYGKYIPFERPMSGVGAAENNQVLKNRLEIRKLRTQLGMKGHGLIGTGRIMNDTSGEIEKARAAAVGSGRPMAKVGVQTDSLGKNTSPATQGASVDAPMPQTNYAKNTLENEFANRLNKKQLAEMNKLQNQAQSGTSQSSSTTTTSNGTTTTTTTTGLANSGLMAALSLSA